MCCLDENKVNQIDLRKELLRRQLDTYKKEMERRLKSIDIEMNSMIWRTVN